MQVNDILSYYYKRAKKVQTMIGYLALSGVLLTLNGVSVCKY